MLLILAALWAAVLIPPAMRARAEASPADSIVSFRRQLRVLQRTGPTGGSATISRSAGGRAAAPAPAPAPAAAPRLAPVRHLAPATAAGSVRPALARGGRAQKRRRDVFFALLTAMVGSLLLALLGQRLMWGLHLVLDVLFVAYVGLLIRMRNLAAEREMKLRFLPGTRPPDPALLLRRTSNY